MESWNPKFEYSDAEVALIKSISPTVEYTRLPPLNLYRCLAEEAFLKNLNGPNIDALRRVILALGDVVIFRMTPEFDKLCEF